MLPVQSWAQSWTITVLGPGRATNAPDSPVQGERNYQTQEGVAGDASGQEQAEPTQEESHDDDGCEEESSNALQAQLQAHEHLLKSAQSSGCSDMAKAARAKPEELRKQLRAVKPAGTQHEAISRKLRRVKAQVARDEVAIEKKQDIQAAQEYLVAAQTELAKKQLEIRQLEDEVKSTSAAVVPTQGDASAFEVNFRFSEEEMFDAAPELQSVLRQKDLVAKLAKAVAEKRQACLLATQQVGRPEAPPGQTAKEKEEGAEVIQFEEDDFDELYEYMQQAAPKSDATPASETSPGAGAAHDEQRKLELKKRFTTVVRGIVRTLFKSKSTG